MVIAVFAKADAWARCIPALSLYATEIKAFQAFELFRADFV
jgi:hypothetical protein